MTFNNSAPDANFKIRGLKQERGELFLKIFASIEGRVKGYE